MDIWEVVFNVVSGDCCKVSISLSLLVLQRPLGSFFLLLVESKSFEFIIEPGSTSFRLSIV
jgi:hypothetical protein